MTTATQQQAFAATQITARPMREMIYDAIKSAGADGLTDEEVYKALGIRQRATASARRLELERSGRVFWTGATRTNESGMESMIWVTQEFPHVARRHDLDNGYCEHCGRGTSIQKDAA